MEKVTVTVNGKAEQIRLGARFEELAKRHQKEFATPILLVLQDGKLRELFHHIRRDSTIEFITLADSVGQSTYLRSLIFLLGKAVCDLRPEWYSRFYVHYMVGNGLYCSIRGHRLSVPEVTALEKNMKKLAERNLPFTKRTVHRSEAIRLFEAEGLMTKAKLFRYRRASQANIYQLENCIDYFFSYLVPSTGYLTQFKVLPYHGGLILQRPSSADITHVLPYQEEKSLFRTMVESEEFGERLGIRSVGDLNDVNVAGDTGDLILLQEAKMEKKIGDIAEAIKATGKRIILIAGPSSSGKTSFSHRLSIQLRALGYNPRPVACDNYFKPRSEYPKDANGQYDFESLDCVRIDRLNQDLNDLLKGKVIQMPTYNFITGEPEYKGDTLQLKKGDLLILEGIHCLNDALTPAIPEREKYKIYISALTQLNIDEHNYIPTTDGRLLRRIIRDNATRGYSAEKTILQWKSVRQGEEKNIFPFQDQADVMVNSALIYELAVLKPYAEPLLFGVPKESKAYLEAQRLLKFLDYFLTIPSETIPKNSLLREFIGGSIFHV